MNLFGEDASTSDTKKRGGPGSRLLALYHDLHHERHGCGPTVNAPARDGKLLKGLAEAIGEDETAQLLRDFMWSRNPRIANGQFTVKEFVFHAPRLNIERYGNGAHDVDERTAHNIDAASRAMGARKK